MLARPDGLKGACMSLRSLLTGQHDDDEKPPAHVPWHHDQNGYYPRLIPLHPALEGLDGVGGVYLLWHRGLDPHWIYIGATSDLGKSLSRARDAEKVLEFEVHGGVYVTWTPIKTQYRDGVVNYLRHTLKPLIIENMDDDRRDATAPFVPVLPPR